VRSGPSAWTVSVVVLALALLGSCGSGGGSQRVAPSTAATARTTTSTTTSTSTTIVVTTTSTTVAPTTTTLVPADPAVALVQLRLAQLGYRPGTIDGRFGPTTSSAVLAFQKHEGLPRTGTITPEVTTRLQHPIGAGPRTASGPRIEIDLDRQIAFVIDAAGHVSTVNISSGNGQTYAAPGGGYGVAYTPTGTFSVYRRIDGVEHAPLGTLYRPLYFYSGWAVHGSPYVPAFPASHGCVRTSYADQDYIWGVIPFGAPVVLYGTSPGTPTGAAPGA
jgi:peptidoglycan hydrolase-like protein with peptidoglycan-binding domain